MKNSVQSDIQRNRQSYQALEVPRSLRPHENSFLLKLDPGKAVPVAAAGLLREDAITNGRFAASFEMAETAEVIINPVSVKVSAYIVPWQAFERFNGREQFDSSYNGKEFQPGDGVIPFIETMARGAEGAQPIMDCLGLHSPATAQVSSMYVEAYNLILNFRNKNLSLDLPQRTRLQADLGPAERERGRHRDIVPSFDQAAMDGAVEIDLLDSGTLPVHGIGTYTPYSQTTNPSSFQESDGTQHTYNDWYVGSGAGGAAVYFESDSTGTPKVNVQFQDANMSFSLAQIEKAKQMQGFAALRTRYSGIEDNDIISNLLDGITMPDKLFENPIFLGSETSVFGYSKRFASDSTNLDESVVSGAAMINMSIATPRIPTGGVLMFIAEVQPERLFERSADPFLTITDVEDYPQTTRDILDEQKVDLVLNKEIDTAHTDPNGLFGYGPLNSKFAVQSPRLGTGYFSPNPAAPFDQNMARIWKTDPTDPSLGTDWYLTGTIPKDVFSYTAEEPFEAAGTLQLLISGRTVFGQRLIESDGDYEKIAELAPLPTDQIDQNV